MNREEAFEHGVKEFCKQAQYSEEESKLMTELVKEAGLGQAGDQLLDMLAGTFGPGGGAPGVPKGERTLAGATFGGLGGGAAGGALGAGAGGLLHYLMAAEKKRKLSDYLKSMLTGGGAGALGGGALGAGIGAEVGSRAEKL